jgi:hypothetical protein
MCNKNPPVCSCCQSDHAVCRWGNKPDDETPPHPPTFGLSPTSRSPEDTACTGQTPSPEQYVQTLSKYLEIYEQFPLIDPFVITTVYESTRNQQEDEKNCLWAMVDALSSLIALYTESEETASLFFKSAKERLESLKRQSVEPIIVNTILVSVLTNAPSTLRLTNIGYCCGA